MPVKVPGLRWLMILTAVYGVVWMGFEGDLRRVVLMGTAVTLSLTGYWVQRLLGGRTFHLIGWLVVTGSTGLMVGLGSSLMTLVFMVLKTGLHGHGPEFRPSEIEWLVGMLPLWALAGFTAGMGIGTVIWGLNKSNFVEEV